MFPESRSERVHAATGGGSFQPLIQGRPFPPGSRRGRRPLRATINRPRPAAAATLAVGLLSVLAGCRTETDPHYNPYARPWGERSILQTADDGVNWLYERLDSFDQRMENAVY